MEQWCEIRQRVLRDGESIRQIQRETGLHFDTIKKILAHPTPPAFRTPVRVKPKLGPYLERIAAILDSDRELPRKQRHTAKRIFERLRDEGYSGGYTQVKEAVRELKRSGGEVFVPLVQESGEVQAGQQELVSCTINIAEELSRVSDIFWAWQEPPKRFEYPSRPGPNWSLDCGGETPRAVWPNEPVSFCWPARGCP